MTRADQFKAVVDLGFTDRQARFLVTVMLFSGVCVGRQYCAFAGIVRGQKMYDFFSSLVADRWATVYTTAHRRAHLYHVHSKRLYAAIGEPHNRHRKPVTLARAVERLMVLDAVLADHRLRWLGSEREKVEYFRLATTLRPTELPHLTFGDGKRKTVRYFTDKLPIGLAADGRRHVFLYLVNRKTPVDFRAFLHRHGDVLRAVPEWEIRLLMPSHFTSALDLYEEAASEEMRRPLRLSQTEEISWYFIQRSRVDRGAAPEDFGRFRRAERAFRGPRYQALYRQWRTHGEWPVHATASPVLDDKMSGGRGHVTPLPLTHAYARLAPMVGSA